MATIKKYAIRSAAGWAGMTSAEQAAYDGYFETLSAWEAIIPADISSGTGTDEQWIAECYNDWSPRLADKVNIDSHTTTATNNIIIRAADADGTEGVSRFTGVLGQGFCVGGVYSYAEIIKIASHNIIVDGIRVYNGTKASNPLYQYRGFRLGGYSNYIVTVKNCEATAVSYAFEGGGDGVTLINCIANNSDKGYHLQDYRNPTLYNCLATNCTTGYYKPNNDSSNANLYNSLAYSCGSSYSGNMIGSNNAASDASTNTPPGNNPLLTDVVANDFVDAANGDYHIATGSQLIGAGLNLIENTILDSPQYDIDGDQWSDTGAWDIGFDYQAISSGNTYTHISSGGTTTGGTATVSAIKAVTATGGTTLIGTAKTATVKAFSSAGGIITGGTAVTSKVDAVTNVYTHTATGGVSVSGTAKQSVIKAFTATGGTSVSGSADVIQLKQYLTTGGITTGGTATTQKTDAGTNIYQHTASGGVLTSGSASIIQIKDYLSSGGTITGGVAITQKIATPTSTYQHVSSGGISLSGSAKVIQIRQYLASGGVITAGSAVTFSNNTQIIDLELVEIEWHSDTIEAVFANDKYGIALK